MGVREHSFAVAQIMQVPAGSALGGFPAFPRAGTLVILDPPYTPEGDELTACAAEVARSTVKLLKYSYWQTSTDGRIGLLCKFFDETSVPLGSPVKFVKRGR
jgi:hypothetical protein